MSQQAQIDVSYPNILSWERDHYVVGTRSYAKGTRSYVVGTRYLCHGNDKILSRENKIKKKSHVPSVLPYLWHVLSMFRFVFSKQGAVVLFSGHSRFFPCFKNILRPLRWYDIFVSSVGFGNSHKKQWSPVSVARLGTYYPPALWLVGVSQIWLDILIQYKTIQSVKASPFIQKSR